MNMGKAELGHYSHRTMKNAQDQHVVIEQIILKVRKLNFNRIW